MKANTHNGASCKVILDTRDQLVTASRTNGPNGAADAAYNYSYSFDEVGNRTNEVRGQTVLDGTFNALNQIRTLNWSGMLDVLGQIGTTNNNPFTVLVNASTATVYNVTNFLGGATLSAGSNSISIVTKDTVPTTNETVKTVFAPPVQPQAFTWDKNGCMTSDGYRDYTWSEENRCTNIETSAAAISMGLPKLKSEYVFDGLGRRVETRDYSNWNGSDYSTTNITRFVWDGFNVLAVLNEDNSIRSYVVRGLDLSQSLQGAGGIGGILAMWHQGTNYLYTADGNGNITEVTDDQGSVVASYIYSPFGKLVSQSGSFASENPWMFSSQWYERRWKHYRYVYRIYLPAIGWASKDRIVERRYINRYAYVLSMPVGRIDIYGLLSPDHICCTKKDIIAEGIKRALEAWQLTNEHPMDKPLERVVYWGLIWSNKEGHVGSSEPHAGWVVLAAWNEKDELTFVKQGCTPEYLDKAHQKPVEIPGGATKVGDYHSHPHADSTQPSEEDILTQPEPVCESCGYTGFLGVDEQVYTYVRTATEPLSWVSELVYPLPTETDEATRSFLKPWTWF